MTIEEINISMALDALGMDLKQHKLFYNWITEYLKPWMRAN